MSAHPAPAAVVMVAVEAAAMVVAAVIAENAAVMEVVEEEEVAVVTAVAVEAIAGEIEIAVGDATNTARQPVCIAFQSWRKVVRKKVREPPG